MLAQACISILGNLIVVIPNAMDCGSFLAGKKFEAAKIPEIQVNLPTNKSTNLMFKLVKIPACLSIPSGCHVVHSPITNQSTADLLNHLFASSGDFWLMHIQSWSTDQQPSLKAAKPFFPILHKDQSWADSANSPLVGVSEDDAESITPAVNALLTACTVARMQNTTGQISIDLTPNQQKGDNSSTMNNDVALVRATQDSFLFPSTKKPLQADNRRAKFCIIFSAHDPAIATIRPPVFTDTAIELSAWIVPTGGSLTFLMQSPPPMTK